MAKRFCTFGILLAFTLTSGCERQGRMDGPQSAAATDTAPDASLKWDAAEQTGVRLALLEPSANMLMASLEGTLRVEGRCLYIVGTDGAKHRTLPAFHIDSIRWDAATRTLRTASAVIAEGQRVFLGGGEVPSRSTLKWVQPPDPSCDASNLFVTGTIEPAPK